MSFVFVPDYNPEDWKLTGDFGFCSGGDTHKIKCKHIVESWSSSEAVLLKQPCAPHQPRWNYLKAVHHLDMKPMREIKRHKNIYIVFEHVWGGWQWKRFVFKCIETFIKRIISIEFLHVLWCSHTPDILHHLQYYHDICGGFIFALFKRCGCRQTQIHFYNHFFFFFIINKEIHLTWMKQYACRSLNVGEWTKSNCTWKLKEWFLETYITIAWDFSTLV